MGLEVNTLLLIGLDNMLASYSPDPQLDTVVEGGDLARLQEDRASRKLGIHQRGGHSGV